MKAALIASFVALHPHTAVNTYKTPTSCEHVLKLVQVFGIDRVVEEARKRGVSEQTIASFKRRCNLDDR